MTVIDERPAAFEPPSAKPASPDPGTMTLLDHLAELRNRLIVSVVAIVVLTTVMWFLYDQVIHFMEEPYCSFTRHHPSKSVAGCSLVTNGPLEGFTTRIKISAYGGIALATPVLFWELWRFITPGLHKNERKYILPFVSSAVVLFLMGVTAAVLIFPRALQWLIEVGGTGVVPLFSPSKYFTLYALMCVIFGAVFTYPLFLVFLEIAGVVPSATWRRWRRPAIVVIAVVAAVVTPSSDPFSFLAMAVPMLVFYEGAILVGRVMHK
jgi:sec-independent protein translocase protein TatC